MRKLLLFFLAFILALLFARFGRADVIPAPAGGVATCHVGNLFT